MSAPSARAPSRAWPSTIVAHHSLLAAQPLGEAIASAWPLRRPVECQLHQPGLNDTYFVTAGTAMFVARVYRAHGRLPDEIAWELELLKHLSKREVSVSVPVATTADGLLHWLQAPEGRRYLALFTYAEGRPLTWGRWEEAEAAGELAASMHGATADFDLVPERPPLDLAHLVDASADALRPYLRAGGGDIEWLERLCTSLRRRASDLVERGLDWGICHGDFGASNIHVTANGRLIAFDFDLSARGWRACDLVPAWAVARHENDDRIWESFLRGYLKRRELTEADLAALPLFYGINRLWSIGVHARNVPYRGSWRLEQERLDVALEALRTWHGDYAGSRQR